MGTLDRYGEQVEDDVLPDPVRCSRNYPISADGTCCLPHDRLIPAPVTPVRGIDQVRVQRAMLARLRAEREAVDAAHEAAALVPAPR